MINIGKLFENNNQTLIHKPSLQSESKAYLYNLYIKVYQKCDANGSLQGALCMDLQTIGAKIF